MRTYQKYFFHWISKAFLDMSNTFCKFLLLKSASRDHRRHPLGSDRFENAFGFSATDASDHRGWPLSILVSNTFFRRVLIFLAVPGGPGGHFGRSWGVQGASWEGFGRSWGDLAVRFQIYFLIDFDSKSIYKKGRACVYVYIYIYMYVYIYIYIYKERVHALN